MVKAESPQRLNLGHIHFFLGIPRDPGSSMNWARRWLRACLLAARTIGSRIAG
jgi:hypothetical protein